MVAFELLAVSDTHGDAGTLAAILAWAKGRGVDAAAFLGDGLGDLERAFDRAGFRPVCRAVRGNGDQDPDVPFHRTADFGGRRFFLTHGHLHAVQDTLDSLVFAARAAGAEAALFGHTHLPLERRVRGVLLVNPGSPSRPRGGFPPSFATIACPPPGKGPLEVRRWTVDADGVVVPA